jgi:hypothetical protein
MLMEPIAAKSPRTGKKGPSVFFTTRSGAFQAHGRVAPSLAEMEAELQGLRQRLRNPWFGLINVVGVTLQRLPQMIPAVARASAAVLRRDSTRHQPPTP